MLWTLTLRCEWVRLAWFPASAVQWRRHCGGGASLPAAPWGWGLLLLLEMKEMTSAGEINPLRARGEIMREIWLFWWSYATSSNTAHAVWSCGSYYLYLFFSLRARGSVTDGKSSSPVCWLKKKSMSEELMSDEIKGPSSGSHTYWPRDAVHAAVKLIQKVDPVRRRSPSILYWSALK